MAVVLLLAMVAYIGYQQFSLNQAIFKNEWKIPAENLRLIEKNKAFHSKLSLHRSQRGSASIRSGVTAKAGEEDYWRKTMKTGFWNDQIICVRPLGSVQTKDIKHKTKKNFLWMRDNIIQTNVLKLHGLVELDKNMMFVSEFCSKGELQDVLFNDKFNLDANFKFSMSTDIAEGLQYLHSKHIIHGNINTSNCYIDARWNVKIADWEYLTVANCQQNTSLRYKPAAEGTEVDSDLIARGQFWQAPELLEDPFTLPSQSSDVYSFAMVLVEIFTRDDLYSTALETKSPTLIVTEIVKKDLRPGKTTIYFSNDTPTCMAATKHFRPED